MKSVNEEVGSEVNTYNFIMTNIYDVIFLCVCSLCIGLKSRQGKSKKWRDYDVLPEVPKLKIRAVYK